MARLTNRLSQSTGEITPQLVAWLSGIKEKNLNGCGKFTLASDMSAIRDITSIDLSNMNTLEGKRSIEVVVETITNLNPLTPPPILRLF